MEVALDVALQCSPDHPWVSAHPEWFTTRADGTIAYAENPPKKYQDIYPLNFDNDPEGIYREIRRVLQVWIDHGVTLFRVDNPHTKPLDFWERILASVRADHPEVIFLSEAFTRPAMMQTLAKIGFHQSYTYFTWRNTKAELTEYLAEVSGEQGSWMRPSFWPTTHDILPPYLQATGVRGFAVRAVLAALGAPTWGIYSGYELVENVPRPGVEEQIDNEKYEFKPRVWGVADGDRHQPAAGPPQRDPPQPPGPAAAAQPARPPDVRRRARGVLAAPVRAGLADRPGRHDPRHRQPGHARTRARAGSSSTSTPSASATAGPSSRTTCCPTTPTSGRRPPSSGWTRWCGWRT